MSPVMNRTRVYAPETNEPFDVTTHKAAELILLKGWTKSPVTRTAASVEVPADKYVSVEEVEAIEADEDRTWRSGRARGRGRKTFGSSDEDEAA